MTNADRKNVSFAQAKPLDTNAIPILDLGPDIRSGDLHHLAKGILHAATNTGFFYIRNHGIPEDAIIRAWAVAKGFFALDGDEKATIAVNKHQRGWMATGMFDITAVKEECGKTAETACVIFPCVHKGHVCGALIWSIVCAQFL